MNGTEYTFPTLYGKSSSGKVKYWNVSAFGDNGGTLGYYKVNFGYLGGQEQTTTKYVEKKNVGKSNETTLLEQAISEAQSLWNSKIDSGYVEDSDNIPDSHEFEFFLPMLAQKWSERSKHLKWPAYCQPKLDGVRAIAKKEDGIVTMWSRKGKEITVPKEILAELTELLQNGQCTDGELYVHGWTFQQVVSAVKKYSKQTLDLQYHIYDVPVKNKSFKDRFADGFLFEDTLRVKRVATKLLESQDDVPQCLADFLSLKYEGIMLRNTDGKYVYKDRSNDLQKLKEFQDAEFEVIGCDSASGRDEGTAVFVCQTTDGKRFSVRPTGTFTERQEYFDNFESKYLGQLLTVKFQDFTDDGIPRFPVGLHFRPKWDM